MIITIKTRYYLTGDKRPIDRIFKAISGLEPICSELNTRKMIFSGFDKSPGMSWWLGPNPIAVESDDVVSVDIVENDDSITDMIRLWDATLNEEPESEVEDMKQEVGVIHV